jgi:hypothetical protein
MSLTQFDGTAEDGCRTIRVAIVARHDSNCHILPIESEMTCDAKARDARETKHKGGMGRVLSLFRSITPAT